jgi:hypothetical protein
VKRRKPLTLTGSVTPGVTGKVKIYLYRRVGGRYKSMGTVNVTLSKGAYKYSFKPKYRGKWRFRARYLGAAPFTPSWSTGYVYTTVK